MTAPVAAAASVPSSFTSTNALWNTSETNRLLAGDMPVSREGKPFLIKYAMPHLTLHNMNAEHIKLSFTREVTLFHVKGFLHAHADQDLLHVVLLLHLEPRQPHLDLNFIHHVWSSPLHKVLIGQLLFQLRVDTKSFISLSVSCGFLH